MSLSCLNDLRADISPLLILDEGILALPMMFTHWVRRLSAWPLSLPMTLHAFSTEVICHAFQPIKDQHLCLVVFCLLFSMIVGIQHQLFHSIIIVGNSINSKQSS